MYSRNIDSKKLEGKGTETDAQQYSQRRRGDTPERIRAVATTDMDDNIQVGVRVRPLLERYTYRSRASYFMHLRATKWVG